ncbi:relaxase/mobilization nuclease domain-containing protein [Chitinophaga sp. NPDC101104]|uniref:relaxase/mobilization nuclease domain-containing protein n=1 Tax=Chitinophaga sp. NPDC101104 TaxID=3390561 RepID=UPI003D0274DB
MQEQKALCLSANGIGWNDTGLSALEKERFLLDITSRNQITEKNALHISLNFHPSEKDRLTDEMLREIASRYMEKIGFGDQPFLLYRHFDTHHPHVHIVTTNIRYDGTRINTQWINQRKSEPARMELENEFGLIRASGRNLDGMLPISALEIPDIEYGHSETKTRISNIVREVVRSYQFTSLQELNAILEQFNVYADGGDMGSKLEKTGGLIFGLLDKYGAKIGRPVKASIIYTKPTKPRLAEMYQTKKERRVKYKARLIRVIDDALAAAKDRDQFAQLLENAKVNVKFHFTKDGLPFGITFIDNLTRCVFNGSDLNKKGYSARAILEKITSSTTQHKQYNYLFIQQVLKQTDFSKRPETILRAWKKNGIRIVIDPGKKYAKFKAGHASLPKDSYADLPAAVSRWLSDLEKSLNNQISSPNPRITFITETAKALSNEFTSLFDKITDAHLSLFDPVYPHYSAPRELLEEARKKKRKKRR